MIRTFVANVFRLENKDTTPVELVETAYKLLLDGKIGTVKEMYLEIKKGGDDANVDEIIEKYKLKEDELNQSSSENDGGYKYEGDYKDGLFHGQGTLTYSDGDQYVGEFKDGKYHGQGTFTWSDGVSYKGEWKDGKYHGQGTETSSDGLSYKGEWKDGKEHGQGKKTWTTDGELNTYEGEYRNGVWHGKGKYIVDLGGKEETICEGIWEEGKFVKGKRIVSDYMYYEGIFNNYILIKGKQVIEHPEGSSTQEGEFNLDGSDKIDFIYTEFSSILDEDECYVGTFKDNGWNDGFIIKVNTGKKIRKVENGTVYKLGFFDKF